MVSVASQLGAWHLWEVVENKLASLLVGPWARHLTGNLTFMWKTGGPDSSEIATPKQERAYRPKHSVGNKFLDQERAD